MLEVFKLGIPYDCQDDYEVEYYRDRLAELRKTLERLTGNIITDDKLNEAIDVYNRLRGLLKTLSLVRREPQSAISSLDFVRLNHVSMYADPVMTCDALEAVCRDIAEPARLPRKQRPRVMLAGPALAFGDHDIIRMITDVGADVVVEEVFEGIRDYWQVVEGGEDPLTRLARSYLLDKKPAAFRQGGDAQEDRFRSRSHREVRRRRRALVSASLLRDVRRGVLPLREGAARAGYPDARGRVRLPQPGRGAVEDEAGSLRRDHGRRAGRCLSFWNSARSTRRRGPSNFPACKRRSRGWGSSRTISKRPKIGSTSTTTWICSGVRRMMGVLLKDMADIVLLQRRRCAEGHTFVHGAGVRGPRYRHQYQLGGREVDLPELHVHGRPGVHVRQVRAAYSRRRRELWLRGGVTTPLRNGEDQSRLDQPGPAPSPRLDRDHGLPLRHQSEIERDHGAGLWDTCLLRGPCPGPADRRVPRREPGDPAVCQRHAQVQRHRPSGDRFRGERRHAVAGPSRRESPSGRPWTGSSR